MHYDGAKPPPLRGRPAAVRKHRAPKGALRRAGWNGGINLRKIVRKRRAPKGALRRDLLDRAALPAGRQKAPSAKRCIKTISHPGGAGIPSTLVRKHRAPKGALRRLEPIVDVRNHAVSQKAPSAKRCIKDTDPVPDRHDGCARKHRAPKGVLRPRGFGVHDFPVFHPSESTERQKVH